jgi:hypothetical protein
MFEYEVVLCRSEHLAASGATAENVRAVLGGLAAVGKPVRLAFRWRPALPDPDEDMVLETAINGSGARDRNLEPSAISKLLRLSSVAR